MSRLEVITDSPVETECLGKYLGALLQPGSFLALQGDLGGGKTCLTRGVVAAIAPQSAHLVSSPTYAIMNSYPGDMPVYHFDFYRLAGDDDIVELGFEEFFYGDGICVAEWSERLVEMLPDDTLTLHFNYAGDDQRVITITGSGEKAESVLEQLAVWLQQQKKL